MEELRKILEENQEEYVRYLKELVAIDTQDIGHGIDGGREKKGQEYLEKLFLEIGADVIEQDQLDETIIEKAKKEFQEGNLKHNYEDRYNLYATFKGKAANSIMFNGHIDTMPPGDLKKWKYNPFEPTVENGKLYGLGSADMKGGLMAAIMAVKLLKTAGVELPCEVLITSVCDEEGGGNGSIQAATKKRADGVVVCEGTSDELILAHMGFVFFSVKVAGKSNHSGAKWKGVSAIEKAIKLIAGLEELEKEWLGKYKHPLLPPPNLNVGVIQGGTAGSTVAGECEFQVCVHYLPKQMSYEQVVKEFKTAIDKVAVKDEWLREHRPEIEVYQTGGAFEMEEDNSFVKAFENGYQKVKNKPPQIVGSPAGCDSRIWKNIAGVSTIQFGPGNLEQCHAVNEYLEIDAYLETILIYAELIISWGLKEKEKEDYE